MTNSNVMRSFVLKGASMLMIVALVVFLSGCLDNDEPNVEPTPVGYVSIYHAAPDAPGMDIIVDNRKINNQSFDYSDHSGYLNFFTGERNLKFTAQNASSALVDTTFSIADGKAYSLFVINTVPDLETLLVQDSAGNPAAGNAMIRFVHLSPDLEPVELKAADAEIEFVHTAFKQATEFKEVAAGTYSFDALRAGTTDAAVSMNDITLQNGGFYTVIIRGFETPPSGNTNVLSLEVL